MIQPTPSTKIEIEIEIEIEIWSRVRRGRDRRSRRGPGRALGGPDPARPAVGKGARFWSWPQDRSDPVQPPRQAAEDHSPLRRAIAAGGIGIGGGPRGPVAVLTKGTVAYRRFS
ncbi:hypothetical protein Afe04nite_81810 [Asanoa ferruginea]|nr:hypothetical protein Afe04nite_81810 [Asanoa ferruginea]